MMVLQFNSIDILLKNSSHILFLILLVALILLFLYVSFHVKYAPFILLILASYMIFILEYNSWTIIVQWWGCDFIEEKVICGFPSYTIQLNDWTKSALLIFCIATIISSFFFILVNYMYKLKEE
jgi:hypothetical protein